MGKNIEIKKTINNAFSFDSEELAKRIVLFEKHQWHFYRRTSFGKCLDECNIRTDGTAMGSQSCINCDYNIAYDLSKNIIVCRKLTEALKR
jgi:hypothetical protein